VVHLGVMTWGATTGCTYKSGLQVVAIPILRFVINRFGAMLGNAFILASLTITAAAAPLQPRNNSQGDPCAALIGVEGCKYLT